MIEAGQLPPQAPELEQAVLGAILISGGQMVEVADLLRPEAFYVDAHRVIYAACTDLFRTRSPIDAMTVTQRIAHRGQLDAVGGAYYVASLTAKMASSANLIYHAHIIVQCFIQRETIRVGANLSRAGHDPTVDVFDLLAGAAHEIRLLNEHGTKPHRTMAEVMPEVIDNVGTDRGIPTGFDGIDGKMRFEPGTVTIIGARPAMGKTSFMLSSAKRQAWMGFRVYVAELEMKDRNLARRLVCGECGIPIWKAKRKRLEEQDLDNMAAWYTSNGTQLARMLIDETSTLTVSSLAARIDRARRKEGIDMVWIDYIGLLQPSTKQKAGYDRMTAISNELRVLAKDMDLPFAVLAQLSRPVKGSAVKAPVLTDLRDSGEIEQDAEAVAFIHRAKYYDAAADDTTDFIIAKNRDGEDGIAHLQFDGERTRFSDVPVAAPAPAFTVSIPDKFTTPNRDSTPF